jgi:hypothetical protein
MPAATMSKEERDQAILGTFRLLDLDAQLDNAVEELEEIAGPQPAFSSFARGFSDEVRNRVLRLVKENTSDPHVQAALLKVIRIGRELLDAERAELQSPVTPEEIQKRKDVERFARFLQEEIAKPVMQAIADVWYAPKVRE